MKNQLGHLRHENDSNAVALELAQLLKDNDTHVNPIPMNPTADDFLVLLGREHLHFSKYFATEVLTVLQGLRKGQRSHLLANNSVQI